MTEPTDALVERCVSATYEELPEAVRDRLKQHLLDFLGLAIGAREHAASSPAFERAIDSLESGSDATVLATGETQSLGGAALLNGAFAHSLDFDDTHRESSLHPGSPVIPAALAVAEREDASGEELLAAIAAGYDVTCGVGRAVDPDAHYDQGFHITATCGTFGATAAAGVVAGLSREAFADAFGVNGSQVAGSLQFLKNGAWNKRLHPGLSARRALTAVALAEAGFRGAEAPLDGDHGFFAAYTPTPHPEALNDVSDRHAVLETALKPYPCCRYMHSAIDALLDVAADVDAADVESVLVDLPKSGVTLTGTPIADKRRPENFVDCQFSMPFAAALSLRAGDAGLAAFLDAQDHLDDPELRRLMDATDVVTTDEVASLFPEQWAARVVVETADDTHERFVDTAPGEPERPLGWDGVTEKFHELVGTAGVDAADADALVAAVRDVDDDDVSALVEAVRVATGRVADVASD
ncbi:MmgE/PrpD family protein [Salinirarus marinus]|uniref:MmgE/PrpD family protein n=1 Tax=Salinirarus marinus TaxID=3068310 RepID=UPI003C6C7D76